MIYTRRACIGKMSLDIKNALSRKKVMESY